MLEKAVWVAAGSAAGGVARYFIGAWLNRGAGAFPWGTVAVNLAGCFLIGFLASSADSRFGLGEHGRLLLMTGFCGGFTTFSAFMMENAGLAGSGRMESVLLNIGVSLFAGYSLFYAGFRFGKFLPA